MRVEEGGGCWRQREQVLVLEGTGGDCNWFCDGLGREGESSRVLTGNPGTRGEENPPQLHSSPAQRLLPCQAASTERPSGARCRSRHPLTWMAKAFTALREKSCRTRQALWAGELWAQCGMAPPQQTAPGPLRASPFSEVLTEAKKPPGGVGGVPGRAVPPTALARAILAAAGRGPGGPAPGAGL